MLRGSLERYRTWTIRALPIDGPVILKNGNPAMPSGGGNATGTILDGSTFFNVERYLIGSAGPASGSIVRNCAFKEMPAYVRPQGPDSTFENSTVTDPAEGSTHSSMPSNSIHCKIQRHGLRG